MIDQEDFVSKAYLDIWNAEEQARIDADIEKYRKADGRFVLDAPAGARVRVEQVSHKFVFGAHMFNFNQLGAHELNEKYKSLYGSLFNSGTIAFYWRPFEPVEGKMRFDEAEEDTEEWWNACKDPAWQRYWRRPPTEPVVKFCESKGIRLHGHTLVWGNREWHYPDWLMAKLPKSVMAEMLTDIKSGASILRQPLDKALERIPDFPAQVTSAIERRMEAIAERYANRVHSWDVCNESAYDFKLGNLVPGAKATRGYHDDFMPGDYCHHAFQTAMRLFPSSAKLNINDYYIEPEYAEQVKDMLARGDKIDIMGLQMHLFNPRQCAALAEGVADAGNQLSRSPAVIRQSMKNVFVPGMPTHLSEITITSPSQDEHGEGVQAVLARNLYRLWFSFPQMMGITWWNVVDGCGAPGEPATSGLFTRDMKPKKSFFALDELVNHEWKTNLEVVADGDGAVSFRGFRGKYRLVWEGADGRVSEKTVSLE